MQEDEEMGIQEEAIQEEFGLEPEQEESPSDDPLGEIPEEDRKYAKGWNADGEKTLEQFIHDGKMIEQITDLRAQNKKMQQDFETRTKNLVKMHEMQQANLRKELESELEDAVNMSDLDKVKRVQQEMQALEEPTVEQPEIDVSVVDDWNKANPWINERSPKSAFAKEIFAEQVQSGVSFEDAISKVENELSVHFPEQEQTRISKTTTSRSVPGQKSQPRKLSWNDLTKDEARFWDQGGSTMFTTKEDYLKTVQDARAAK